jgi:hypothetical protein
MGPHCRHTVATLCTVTGMAETTTRKARVEDELWDPLGKSAKALHTNTSELLRRIIHSYNTGTPLPPNPLLNRRRGKTG